MDQPAFNVGEISCWKSFAKFCHPLFWCIHKQDLGGLQAHGCASLPLPHLLSPSTPLVDTSSCEILARLPGSFTTKTARARGSAGRHDSMGHSAKYGTYSIFCCTIGYIIHLVLVQVIILHP